MDNVILSFGQENVCQLSRVPTYYKIKFFFFFEKKNLISHKREVFLDRMLGAGAFIDYIVG